MTDNKFTFILNDSDNDEKNLSEYKINKSTDIINVDANSFIDSVSILYNEYYDRFNIQVFQKGFNKCYVNEYKWGIYIKYYNNDPWLIFIDDCCYFHNLNNTAIYVYEAEFDYFGSGHENVCINDAKKNLRKTMFSCPDYTEKLTLVQFQMYIGFLATLKLCNGYHMENTMLLVYNNNTRLEIGITDKVYDKYTLLHKFA